MRYLVRRLPIWVRTQPLDATLALFGIPPALAALLGQLRSAALAELLPWLAIRLWAVCLLIGCAAWLAGLMSMREENGQLLISRLPILILGLALVSVSAVVYGVAILIASGWAGALAAWPLLVAAAGTYLRRVDLSDRYRAGGR
jgi:hypothetical protein